LPDINSTIPENPHISGMIVIKSAKLLEKAWEKQV